MDLVLVSLFSAMGGGAAVVGLVKLFGQKWIDSFFDHKLAAHKKDLDVATEVAKSELSRGFHEFTLYVGRRHTVYAQIYEAMLDCAMRMNSHIRGDPAWMADYTQRSNKFYDLWLPNELFLSDRVGDRITEVALLLGHIRDELLKGDLCDDGKINDMVSNIITLSNAVRDAMTLEMRGGANESQSHGNPATELSAANRGQTGLRLEMRP